MTWVLFVIVYSGTAIQPIGVTSVPGYGSQTDCVVAVNEMQKAFRDPKIEIQTACIPGPTK
jgi:hypothetical protein